MARNIKYGKIAIVIVITLLIWVWADLALDERLSLSNITLTVAKSTDPSLWVSFEQEPSEATLGGIPAAESMLKSSVSIENIVLRGPASKIADVRRKLEDGSLILKFFLDVQQEGMVRSDEYPLNVLNFLRKSDQIRQLGLTVESCQPSKLTVVVRKLAEKSLTVKCYDESAVLVKTESIEPAKVNMFVPQDWEGEKLIAKVQLTRREINQARVLPVIKIPYIDLPGGQRRQASTTVRITTSAQQYGLNDYLITATLGIALSPTLQGRYKVEITNLDVVMSAIAIRATAEAKRAYEAQPFPKMTLYILDEDSKTTERKRRQVVYNFPQEYVRRDEIMLNQQPVITQFRLIPLPSTSSR